MIYKNGVKQEKYGWRDESISRRHRLYGRACTMVDLDFIVIEYHLKEVVALIEYKHENGEVNFNVNDSNYQALISLGDRSGLPFFVVFYNPDSWTYKIHPMTKNAFKWIGEPSSFEERDYVRFLYKIRYIKIKEEILDKIPPIHTPKESHDSDLSEV